MISIVSFPQRYPAIKNVYMGMGKVRQQKTEGGYPDKKLTPKAARSLASYSATTKMLAGPR